MDVLLVIDLQNDFVDGALGNKGNDKIVKPIENLVENFDGEVIFTRDTHDENYLESLEGSHLPVKHCIKNSKGWQIRIDTKNHKIIDKPSFGSYELVEYLKKLNEKEKIKNIYMVGICTDICVLSNAILIKNALLNTEVTVIEDLCKATNEKNHKIALEAMKSCQVNIIDSKGK
ncbi:cysteine hydrolase [Anaerococcus vaginalis]|uniref:Isochorismatase family protein n=2 Tax=Anaerococcus vaginalis TaxID=33037 RepID=C7HVI9_9FIRM|nr:isochorismatase family cysteine hydrolase [Anaerococcus vaginalis]EEU12272.1 isochorismatase family protein [Anaerococcus vaginalis ATCC 51170]MDU5341409.1 isochorismatase family cysteine hydrolase [Anaerococcus vaginalis]QQB61640.1 cysteine hydrolase [Anaerococcus vaginalis]